MTTDMHGPEPEKLASRLLRRWQAALRRSNAPNHPRAHPRELGRYTGGTLHALAATGAGLVKGMSTRDRSALAQGIALEWLQQRHEHPHPDTLLALAFTADMLHAAIDGVRGAGREHLDDAHELAVQLQECLAACAEGTDIIEGLQRMLAEAAGGDD